jgi:hypothetical protein
MIESLIRGSAYMAMLTLFSRSQVSMTSKGKKQNATTQVLDAGATVSIAPSTVLA